MCMDGVAQQFVQIDYAIPLNDYLSEEDDPTLLYLHSRTCEDI